MALLTSYFTFLFAKAQTICINTAFNITCLTSNFKNLTLRVLTDTASKIDDVLCNSINIKASGNYQ